MNQLERFEVEVATHPQSLPREHFESSSRIREVAGLEQRSVQIVSVGSVPVPPSARVEALVYGKCRLCGGSIAIPGLDRSLCTNGCGWVISLQVMTGGGR
jgi:hypothetical protein